MSLNTLKAKKDMIGFFVLVFFFIKINKLQEEYIGNAYKHFCKARIITEDNGIIKENDVHNHAAEASFLEKEKLYLK